MEALVNEINLLREKHKQQVLAHSQLLTQQTESTTALEEIKLVEDDARIYKSTGPILASQTKEDAISTITKRLEYIKNEINTVEKTISSLQSSIEEKCKKLESLNSEAIQRQNVQSTK
ncbi:hypothetical protein BEWA_031760 [Theileria equi strain WA]|uniref:Prefoldin subunit 6 n=1 Tax=Theileria equi strain WA TaxID=1537102 RepID=L0AYJ5_THEEQ|nr:hypothetical protein BEWA_031760 [Theileria equi strain WA]AFZ80323.1 hypothetical protein BEWA_031760 [Theileria equi strain WA]|eukprot:XP_004829989.1 hypothetical protein BEWA_031760 [Theileria equi strain WA]